MVLFRQQQGQASLEYVLVVGAVVVALVGFWALAPDMVNAVSGLLCSSVDTAAPVDLVTGLPISCL